MSLEEFKDQFSTEEQCWQYLFEQRWPNGFVCPKCGANKHYRLVNGRLQCAACRYQASVTAGTVMHKSHAPLTKWFEAFYFVSQDKRGISAVELQSLLHVTYKTAWYMLYRIRQAMEQRDNTHMLSGTIEFDDAFFGGPTTGKKRGRGTEKAKVFVALSLDEKGNPKFLKMKTTEDTRSDTVRAFAMSRIEAHSTILTDGCTSYVPALTDYDHRPQKYDPKSGMLHWIHTVISNAKAFILGTFHGLPSKYLDSYLEEFCFRFSRRKFGKKLFQRLALAMVSSKLADLKG